MNVKELEKMMKEDVGESGKEMKQMKEIKKFYEVELFYHNIEIYGTKEEPLFLAKQVAEILGYAKNSNGNYRVDSILRLVDNDEKLMSKILVSGQMRDVWFLTEDGFYETCFQSTLPIAKKIKKEIKKILKEIRLKGGYVVEHREEEFIENHYDFLSSETKNAMLSEMREHIKKQNAIIEEQNKKYC